MNARETARQAVKSSVVLLKNEGGVLPLPQGAKVALFGWAQWDAVLSGNGSGAARGGVSPSVVDALKAVGVRPEESLSAWYQDEIKAYHKENPSEFDFTKIKDAVNSGLMYEIFGKYIPNPPEFSPPQELLDEASRWTDTALWIVGRKSGGEECDRRLENDYYLSNQEKVLLEAICAHFPKVAVVLNGNGLMDLSWVEEHSQIQALLFLGVPGEEGPAALAELLVGKANPSGKLSVTIAKRRNDYPAWEDFSWEKDHPKQIKTYEDYGLTPPLVDRAFAHRPVTAYREDIYLGYRYFDSFGIEPLYPFGFGLSYTSFSLTCAGVAKTAQGLTVKSKIKNTGFRSGREVSQVYVSAQVTAQPHPFQELKAFAKTGELAPGQTEIIAMTIPWKELASFREDRAAWVIEAGTYLVKLGNSSAHTQTVAVVRVEKDILVQQVENRLVLDPVFREKLHLLVREPVLAKVPQGCPVLGLFPEDVPTVNIPAAPAVDCSALTENQLACLCVGYGSGLPFPDFQETELPSTLQEDGRPLTVNDHPAGYNGYVSPAVPERGIHSMFYKDGPAGVGGVSWPGEMLLACSFDVDALYQMGNAVGAECEAQQVDVWLAPALNLHRHPLGGRNFEYYSEDPFLTGAMGAAVLRGVQENHKVLVCAKHFAANEQETYRRGSAKLENGIPAFDAVDSLVSERALRELYLKPFQMAVEAGLHCVMTSFNKVNGTFAGGSKDLCTHILREEWGFDGVVVTDWGDMDIVVDGAEAVAAGNDIIMPGGPPVIQQILKGKEESRLTRQKLEIAVEHLLSVLRRLERLDRHDTI